METCDYLIIGSGIAGLSLALKAATRGSVIIVTKDRLPESNSAYAQGGIASVWSPEDSFDAHIQDTHVAGAELCHEDVVEAVVREGPDRIRELIALGTNFSRRPGGEDAEYDLGLEGGHSHRRILHASDATGQEIIRALIAAVRQQPNILILEKHLGIDLLTSAKPSGAAAESECWGAYALDLSTNQVQTIPARVTVLCTGGAGKVYLYTSNPDVATGDGLAMAYRAGASLGNLEFFQFHPTCLFHPKAKSFLISEALRGEGAKLRRPDGTPFMEHYDTRAELAPRDIVARAIDSEMKKHGFSHVLLDISHRDADFLQKRFPAISRRCLEFGIDLTREPIPVVPAAHYLCGGVLTDLNGGASIGRLYAAGEVAMTGLHGANRLASNSLLEAVVFAHRVFVHSQAFLAEDARRPPMFPEWNPGHAVNNDEMVVVTHTWEEIRRLMWNYVGIVRSDRRLARAQRRIALIQEEIREYYWNFLVTGDLLELRNLATVAELIIRCASLRRESRGLHYTLDYPDVDDVNWRRDTIVRLGQ
ncbi:MAG: L-aspartate oxidase [Deltaproteobacteria bacterium]|nr:L-aspartate oxidase [Deltaproteobacteria bacterium]